MKRYCTIYYLAVTACLSAFMVVVALATVIIKFGNSSFQIADGLYLALVSIIPGPMTLIVGVVYPMVFDFMGGSFIFIPLSIVIHILMFSVIKLLPRKTSIFLLFPTVSLLIFAYVPFNYWLDFSLGMKIAQASALKELIVDSLQFFVTALSASLWSIIFRRAKLDEYLWRKTLGVPKKD